MKRGFRVPDPLLFWLACAASLVGVFFIFDAGYARALMKDHVVFNAECKQQVLLFIPAILISVFASKVTPAFWKKFGAWIWGLTFIALLAVEKFGHELNGAKRWIFGVQPAEFAKVALVLYLAAIFANRPAWPTKWPRFKDWGHWADTVLVLKLKRILPALTVLVVCLLIEREKDLGTAAVIAATSFVMFFIGKVSRKSILAIVLIAVGGAVFMVEKQPYRLDRITNHTRRWDKDNVDDTSYQTVQSEFAISTGGLFGVGIGNGRAKHVLPATTTDFIMATVGEETGLVGSMFILALLGAVVWRLFHLSRKTNDAYSKLVLMGIGSWIGIQACVNVMMANGFLPAIGIPLPFISSGGSSLIALWLAVGVCQSVLVPVTENKEAAVAVNRNRWGHRRTRLSGA